MYVDGKCSAIHFKWYCNKGGGEMQASASAYQLHPPLSVIQ